MTERTLTVAEFYEALDVWAEIYIKDAPPDSWAATFRIAWEFLQKQGWKEVAKSDKPEAPDTFCNQFHDWAKTKSDEKDFYRHWCTVTLAIGKSCLLDRLIYGGEKLRTRPCPKHKGTWSGISFSKDEGCECSRGSCACTTGWLPND